MKKAFLSFIITTFVMIGYSQLVDIGYFGNENIKITYLDRSFISSEDFNVSFELDSSVHMDMTIDCSSLFGGHKNLQAFVSSLMQMREKFAEWKKIAEQNNVTNLQKTMTNIVFSHLKFFWRAKDGTIYVSPVSSFSPLFVVSDTGTCSVIVSGQVRAMKYPEIEQAFSFSFSNIEQIDHLVRLLDYDSMKKKCDDKTREEQRKKDLFPD